MAREGYALDGVLGMTVMEREVMESRVEVDDDEYTHKTVSRTHQNTLEVTYFINGTSHFLT